MLYITGELSVCFYGDLCLIIYIMFFASWPHKGANKWMSYNNSSSVSLIKASWFCYCIVLLMVLMPEHPGFGPGLITSCFRSNRSA